MRKRFVLAVMLLILILWDGLSRDSAVQVVAQAVNDTPLSSSVITPQNVNQLRELATLGRGAVNDMAWSPDGTTLAVASAAGIWLYNRYSLDNPRHISVANVRISSVAYSPDGNQIVSGDDDGVVRVWDVDNGRELRSAQVDHLLIRKIAFNADGKTIAVGEYNDSDNSSGALWLWNLETGSKKFLPEGKGITALAFNPAGTLLAFGISSNDTVQFWDMSTMEIRHLANTVTISYGIYALDFSRDGKRLAVTGGDDSVVAVDGVTGEFVTELHVSLEAYATAISPDGTLLVGADMDGVISVASTVDFTEPDFTLYDKELFYFNDDATQDSYTGSPISMLAFNPDGKLLASAAVDGVISLWDVKTRTVEGSINQQGANIQALSFSPDGKKLYGANGTLVARSWDIQSGQQLTFTEGLQLAQYRGSYPFAESVAISANAKLLARGVSDGHIDLWNLQTGKKINTQIQFKDSSANSLAFSPDGKTLAAIGDLHMGIFDLNTGKEQLNISIGYSAAPAFSNTGIDPLNLASIYSAAPVFNPQGTVLALSDRIGFVYFRDMLTGRQTNYFGCSNSTISSLTIDPTGTWLAAGSEADAQTNISKLCFANLKLMKTGAKIQILTDRINGLAFSPDGLLLATVSSDQTLRLWNPSTGTLLATYHSDSSPIQTIAFSPQGTLIAIAGTDGVIKLWGIPAESEPSVF